MNSLLLAIQFLTVIPARISRFSEKQLPQAVIYFPFVGLLLGIILAGGSSALFILGFGSWITSVILVILLIILTGGMHLDGLADTVDALASSKTKTEMLAIMRDSRIGTMGVLSLISVLLLKITILSSLGARLLIPSLLLMCILSRWSMSVAMFTFSYAREEGKAGAFIKGMTPAIFIFSTLIAICCVILSWSINAIILMPVIYLSTYLSGAFVRKHIGGITGDTIGAISEINEIITLTIIYTSGRFINA